MDQLLANLPLAFALVFGFFMLLIGLVLIVAGGALLKDWFRAIGWQQATGQVVSSEVKREEKLEGQVCYRPVVSYSFACRGDQVTGNRIALADRLYRTEAAASKAIARYPVGMVVNIRFPADDPADAILERRGAVAGFFLLLLGLVQCAAVLVAGGHFGLPVMPIAAGLIGLAAVLLVFSRLGSSRLRRARAKGLYPLPGKGSDEDVKRLVLQGEKLLAIRLYRDLHGTDLKSSRLKILEFEKCLKGENRK